MSFFHSSHFPTASRPFASQAPAGERKAAGSGDNARLGSRGRAGKRVGLSLSKEGVGRYQSIGLAKCCVATNSVYSEAALSSNCLSPCLSLLTSLWAHNVVTFLFVEMGR